MRLCLLSVQLTAAAAYANILERLVSSSVSELICGSFQEQTNVSA